MPGTALTLHDAAAIVVGGVHTDFSKGYDRCGTLCAEDIGIRIGPNGSKIPVFDGGVKIDTKIAHEHDPQAALC